MKNKLEILVPNATYHIYNRANGNEKVFLSEENYRFFKSKFKMYIFPVAEVYCYCLMPNHFHYLLRIRSEKELEVFFGEQKLKNYEFSELLSKQFSNFFSSYTQAFNKVNFRMGSLFIKNFKRKRINDDLYFRNVVHYIHHNPIEARLSNTLEDYNYSSYQSIIQNNKSDFLLKYELINFFGTMENFRAFHENRFGGKSEGLIASTLD